MSDGDSPAKALETGIEEDLVPAVEDASQAVESAVKSVGTGVQGAAGRFDTVEGSNTGLFTKEIEGGSQGELSTASTEARQAAQTVAPKSRISQILGGEEESVVPQAATEDRQALLDELTRNGVKHNPDSVVNIARGDDGQVKFLETGNSRAGLKHFMKHAGEFEADDGITEQELPDYVMTAATKGEVVSYQETSNVTPRPIVQFEFGGKTRRLAITVGDNGFIVGGNSVGFKAGESE